MKKTRENCWERDVETVTYSCRDCSQTFVESRHSNERVTSYGDWNTEYED